MNYIVASREEREKDIDTVITVISCVLQGKIDVVKIKGRPKTMYSIYRKITERGFKLDEMHDLLGIRVIVPEVKDCYIVLGLLHETYEPLEGKLKDYIAYPKPNFYRSLHTAVHMKKGKIVEVQIRTPEMDEFAEEGIAAHWRYKGLKSDDFFEKKIAWLRNVLDLQKDSNEFLESAKIDVFGDKIYCYTPKGEMKELPLGATILDFAYVVHEEIGNTAVGGRVNGKFVPLKHELQKGDVVEIVTNKSQQPRRNWIKFVKSARARQKIRKYLKEHEKLAPLYFRVIKPNVVEDVGVLVESVSFPRAVCALAQCCQALPGEKIVGLVTKRRVISVHKEDCRAAQKEMERWVSVRWKDSFGQKIQFYVEGQERSGMLADVLHTIAMAGFSVKEAKAKMVDVKRVQCSFRVIPRDLEQLVGLVQRVKKVRGIQKVYFE
ncbi:MAG: TGS domain-containing protein [Nanoarchaeota archaeon]